MLLGWRALIWKEATGYSVWTVSPYTGDRKDCLGFFDRKDAARRAMRAFNRSQDRKDTGR